MRWKLYKLPQFLKSHSLGIVTQCVRNCECLMAYKLRRGQQMFSLYSKLWGEARFKDLLQQIRRKMVRQFTENKMLMFGGGIVLFDWNENRIPDKEMKEHYVDLDYISFLVDKTVTCSVCHKRLVVDAPIPDIVYCSCPGSKPVYNKTFDSVPWTPFIERPDLLIWRKEEEQHAGLYEYKLFGIYREVRADIFLKVQIDTEFRKQWDATAVEIRVIDSEPVSNSDVLYWEMKWPKFFANRDYVFNRRYVVDREKNVIVITNQVANHPGVPENSDKFRVKEYYCTMVIKPLTTFDQPGLQFCMTYFDNPGLSIPAPVQTWVATSAMPSFLARLRAASASYDSPGPISEWMSEVDMRSSGMFDDFSTVFLVEEGSLTKELPALNIYKENNFPS